ncbi:hypothetical protein ACN20G_22880 [Streptomyces sp. BI20]|uniref:hypothetical protein n=1 Tax=Streptomyces sp. BI20 TaxID=3403460 RepID=UPI003C72F157
MATRHPLHEVGPGGAVPFGPVEGRPPAPPDPERVDPGVLGALLARHGWRRRGGPAGRYGRWTPPGPGGARTSLLIPESRAGADCVDLVEEALTALARGGLPAGREVLFGLSVPSDEIRWTREVGAGEEDAWVARERLWAAARRMLIACALAERARVGYHGARHRERAERALDRVLVAPAGAAGGGRELTVYVPVVGGRTLVTLLHHAAHAAREAVDLRRATAGAGLEAFDAAVAAGVGREFTDALIALVTGAEGGSVAPTWAPAAGAPAGCAARPEPVEFSPGDLPTLREAAVRYTTAEPSVPVRIDGAVQRLRRRSAGGGGTVRIRVLAGAEVSVVRVALDEAAYRTAGEAHLRGLPVRVEGRLQRRGGFRRLADPHGLTVLPLDAVERDRLMKSLGEESDAG